MKRRFLSILTCTLFKKFVEGSCFLLKNQYFKNRRQLRKRYLWWRIKIYEYGKNINKRDMCGTRGLILFKLFSSKKFDQNKNGRFKFEGKRVERKKILSYF
jgi:hypothetical protein